MVDILVELLKSRARAQRWMEQVVRIRAEFARLVATDISDARMWEERAEKWALHSAGDFHMRRPADEAGKPNAPKDKLHIYDGDEVLKAGLCAYAHKQAHYRRERARANDSLRKTKAAKVDRLLAKYSVDGLLREA